MSLYLLTCSEDTIKRFNKSIVNAIFLDDVNTLISDDIKKQLPSDRFNLWGFKNGKNNDKNWEKMKTSDSVFFIKWESDGKSNIIAKGKVIAKEKNITLAEEIWGSKNKIIWEQIFYLTDIELTNIPVYHKNLERKEGGYYKDKAIQGSKIIDESNPNYNYLINLLEDDYMLSTEENKPSEYREGFLKKTFVNRYERNLAARNRCIELKGYQCLICGFDFGTTYGEEFKGYIHVHHLVPLHDIGEDYEVSPEKDLIPICPNCHAAIHILLSKKPDLSGNDSIEKLRALITK